MQTIQISTPTLQALVARSAKGASNNKLVPVTSLISIQVHDKKFTITTTDASNTLTISHLLPESVEDFEAVVSADVFSKLISKVTTEKVTLSVIDGVLEVKANGTYKLEMPMDEDGKVVRIPVRSIEEGAHTERVSLVSLRAVLAMHSSALSKSFDSACLMGYYFDKTKVVTTDGYVVCATQEPLFSQPVLLMPSFLELAVTAPEAYADFYFEESGRVFVSTQSLFLSGHVLEGIEDYPVAAVENYLQSAFPSNCKLSRTALLGVLDRLSLFVSPYDNKAIDFVFGADGVYVKNLQSRGVETLPYRELAAEADFKCSVNVDLLREQLVGHTAELVEISYGNQSAIRIFGDKVTQIISLLQVDAI